MKTDDLQIKGLYVLSGLAALLIALLAWVLYLIASHAGPDGRVPSAEAFGFTALLLAFREVISALKGIWDHADRSQLTAHLADSAPTPVQPTKTTVEGEA